MKSPRSSIFFFEFVIAWLAIVFVVVPMHAQQAGNKQLPGKKQKKKPKTGLAEEEITDILPSLEDMLKKIPSKTVLERRDAEGTQQDWLVLLNEDVIISEPIYPQPNTLEQIKKRHDDHNSKSGPKTIEERNRIINISVIPVDDESKSEYQIDYRRVKQVIHHEDLVLMRAAILQNEGKLTDAYELIHHLKRRKSAWPKIEQSLNRNLHLEAQKYNNDKKHNFALVLLESLHKREKTHSELQEELGRSCEPLISQPFALKDYPKSRYFLDRLIAMEPNHAVAKKWSVVLSKLSEEKIDQAVSAFDAKNYPKAARDIEEATRIWPRHPRMVAEFNRIKSRFQTLRVGVINLPGRLKTFPVPTLADAREKYLFRANLFEAEQVSEFVHYRSPFFEQWDPSNLGRKVAFSVAQDRPYWESLRNPNANEIVATLKARMDENHPEFDERFESYVKSITVTSPTEFQLVLKRVPPRMESLFAFPVIDPLVVATSAVSQNEESTNPNLEGVLSRRFVPVSGDNASESMFVYRRSRVEPDGVAQYHIGEISERRYPNYIKAVQGLVRGEIDMLPRVQSWDVRQFRDSDSYTAVRYTVPVTHVLQFHPKSEPLESREIRRALEHALNRQNILARNILHDSRPRLEFGRLTSAPFATSSYAYRRGVAPRKYDPILALALGITSISQYENKHRDDKEKSEDEKKFPVLKMIVDPDPMAQHAARLLVASWKRVQIEVQIVPYNPDAPHDWDIVYRVSRMIDPVVELWPYLTFENRANVASLEILPDWLRQELIQLDYARSWNSAVSILNSIHEHLAREAFVIPLWEIDDYLVHRKTVLGPKANPLHTYHGVESWRIPAKFSR